MNYTILKLVDGTTVYGIICSDNISVHTTKYKHLRTAWYYGKPVTTRESPSTATSIDFMHYFAFGSDVVSFSHTGIISTTDMSEEIKESYIASLENKC